MNRSFRIASLMVAAVAVMSFLGAATVEAGCRHRSHGHHCHQAPCEDVCVVEECVVEQPCAADCGSDHGCGHHHRRRCHGLFGHHRHRHCHSHCETVACDSGCGEAVVVVESGSGCASGDCHGGEVVSGGTVVTGEAAPATVIHSSGTPSSETPTPAPAPKPAPPAPPAPVAPKTTGT